MKFKQMIKILAVLLTIPFLMVAILILFVIMFFSKINKRDDNGNTWSDLGNDDLAYCVTGINDDSEPPQNDGSVNYFRRYGYQTGNTLNR